MLFKHTERTDKRRPFFAPHVIRRIAPKHPNESGVFAGTLSKAGGELQGISKLFPDHLEAVRVVQEHGDALCEKRKNFEKDA